MKGIKFNNSVYFFLSLIIGIFITLNAQAQENDDLYFNKGDRKTVKVVPTTKAQNNAASSADYKELTNTTENYSAKNVNPEYIARYKNTEVAEESVESSDSYDREDYFVEDYEAKKQESNIENYLESTKYDRNYTTQSRASTPNWNTSMSFGYGSSPWGWGSSMAFGIGYGMGYGMNPAMSWGMGGYSPYGYGMGYPYYGYSPYSSFYDPWGPGYGYRPYGYGFNPYRYAYNPYRYGYNPYRYGGYMPGYYVGVGSMATAAAYNGNGTVYQNREGRTLQYNSRESRSSTSPNYNRARSNERIRSTENTSNLRTATRNVNQNSSSGRIATRDYSKSQNEYYNRSRTSASNQRISSSSRSRSNYGSAGRGVSQRSSSINTNRPSRSSGFGSSQSGYQRNTGSSNWNNNSRSSSSYSSPSRSSSYSSGSGASRSSGSSYSGASRSSSGSSTPSRSRR